MKQFFAAVSTGCVGAVMLFAVWAPHDAMFELHEVVQVLNHLI